jgi:acyl-CoA synthetase (AMP-forming)/AMP-acid ligase II
VLNGLNVGQIDANARVKIISITDDVIDIQTEEQLTAITVPVNAVGEIVVSGNHVLRQYLNNPEALKRNKIFIGDNCWHRTGDSGYLDADACLFLTGRCSGIIYTATQTVYPFVYENYLQTITGIEMGTVLLNNSLITAVVELNDAKQSKTAEVQIRLNSPIQQVIFLKKIPRDPRHNSKIDYCKLTDMLNTT